MALARFAVGMRSRILKSGRKAERKAQPDTEATSGRSRASGTWGIKAGWPCQYNRQSVPNGAEFYIKGRASLPGPTISNTVHASRSGQNRPRWAPPFHGCNIRRDDAIPSALFLLRYSFGVIPLAPYPSPRSTSTVGSGPNPAIGNRTNEKTPLILV